MANHPTDHLWGISALPWRHRMHEEDMLSVLRNLYRERAAFFQQRFSRLLPLGDMIVDRWEKAKQLGFGEGANVYDSALVLGDVKVGPHTWVGPNTILDASGGPLTIGAYCSVSAGVQIYTHDSVAWALSAGRRGYSSAPTSIGDQVYIGPYSVVTKGVEIGDHVIIGAFSLVNKSIPAHSLAYGQPAKIIGKIILDTTATAGYRIYPLKPSCLEWIKNLLRCSKRG